MRARNARWLLMLIMLAGISTPGCEVSCKADRDNSVEDVVDEIGDEVEDVSDSIRRDRRD